MFPFPLRTPIRQFEAGGVHPPWDHDAFPPVSDFPLFQKKFRTFWEIFTILPFPEKFLNFHPPKFLMTFFFSHRPQISNFPPYFRCFSTFPPCFAKTILFPLRLQIFPPVLGKFTCFYILYVYFPPLLWPWCIYASPNARTGRPWKREDQGGHLQQQQQSDVMWD